jgi:hypothetical protein
VVRGDAEGFGSPTAVQRHSESRPRLRLRAVIPKSPASKNFSVLDRSSSLRSGRSILTPAPVDAPSNQEDGHQDQPHSGLRYAQTVLTEPAVSDMPIADGGSGAGLWDREPAKWQDRGRAYQVLIDGQPVGEVRNGATAEFVLTRGPAQP